MERSDDEMRIDILEWPKNPTGILKKKKKYIYIYIYKNIYIKEGILHKNMVFPPFFKAFSLLNPKIWTLKQAYLESKHHNHSKDMLLDQNKGRRDDKVSSQS